MLDEADKRDGHGLADLAEVGHPLGADGHRARQLGAGSYGRHEPGVVQRRTGRPLAGDDQSAWNAESIRH